MCRPSYKSCTSNGCVVYLTTPYWSFQKVADLQAMIFQTLGRGGNVKRTMPNAYVLVFLVKNHLRVHWSTVSRWK